MGPPAATYTCSGSQCLIDSCGPGALPCGAGGSCVTCPIGHGVLGHSCVATACEASCRPGYTACHHGCCPLFTPTVLGSGRITRDEGLDIDGQDRLHVVSHAGSVVQHHTVDGTTVSVRTFNTGGTIDETAIAVEPNGTAHLVWCTRSPARVYYARDPGTGITTPVPIGTSNSGIFHVSVAVDPTGMAHIAYGGTGSSSGFAFYVPMPGGVASTEVATPAVGGVRDISIDVTSAGVPMISVGGWSGLYLADRTGGTWSHHQVHGSVFSEHALEVDAAGNPHLLYILNQQRYWSKRTNGSWLPVPLETQGSNNLDFALAVNAQGEPRVMYLLPGSPSQTRYGERAAAVWLLSSPGYFGPSHALALDSAGNPRVAYGRNQLTVAR